MQAVVSDGLINKTELVKDIIKPTRRGKRFLNYLLDVIFFYTIIFAFGIILGGLSLLTGKNLFENSMPLLDNFIGITLFMAYYITFESIFGKTIGKMATNTKVVRMDGSKPTLQNIIGRSFARLIPFDAFTFLSKNPRGWHDSLTNTIVIDDISLYSIEKPKEMTEESF
jgi:uncharacterized RDD family membrane protein YckC